MRKACFPRAFTEAALLPVSRPSIRLVANVSIKRLDQTSRHQRPAMRYRMRVALLVAALLAVTAPALAKDADPNPVQGLWFATDYPALQIRAGEDTTLPLTLYNYGLPPQRTALTITDKPADWKAEITGGGKPVSAAFVDHDGRASLSLKLTIPASAKPGDYKLMLHAEGDSAKSDLPITINLAAPLAAKLTATPKFPVLKGSPKSSFDFNVTVKNESGSDMLVNLSADAPEGFTTAFKEGYGAQELTSLPFKAGESKDLTVSVKPAPDAPAGAVPVVFHANGEKAQAQTKLTLDIAGQPTLSLSGQDGRLSGAAYAGQEKSFPLVIHNSGTAPARDVTLTASPPSGWKVTFDPKQVADIPVDGDQKVNALVTPSAKALAGDYMVTMRASGSGQSQSADYRVSVTTSTLWGMTGIGVIGAALLVLVGAVGRFGRR
jgi:uncharacterized membrane protein